MGENWCDAIPDITRINELAIPGTHDAAAWTKWPNLPSLTPGTWAQRMNITEQLNLGVRVLDLRVGYASNNFTLGITSFVGMFHGPIYLNVTLQDVLTTINTWLVAHPREFVMLIFQQQGKPGQRDVAAEVRRMVADTFGPRFKPWRSHLTQWPTLGDLRGKVIGLGRMRSPVVGFADVGTWLRDGDNTDCHLIPAGDSLRILLQDRYKGLSKDNGGYIQSGFTSIEDDNQRKFAKVRDAALLSELTHPRILSINHLSYSNLRYQPWESGEGVNTLLRRSTITVRGVLMLDDVDAATANWILAQNQVRRTGQRSFTRGGYWEV